MADRPRSPGRRRLIRAGLAAAFLAAVPSLSLAQDLPVGRVQGGIAVVSRERILREAGSASRLREAEEALTQRLQAQIDETKAAFAAEEESLARLRGELPVAEFEARVAAFDERVRLARRNAQERATALQKGFQDARAAIVAALPRLLEQLRVEAGVDVILNAEDVLALDPAMDLTDRAIALFDAQGPAPTPPQIDLSTSLFHPAAPAETPSPSAPSPGALTAPVAPGGSAAPGAPPPASAGSGG